MRKTSLTLAMLATVASFTTVVHAATPTLAAPSTFSAVSTATGITFNFTGLTLAGFYFNQLTGLGAEAVVGTLTSVSVNATLDASIDYTYADDLTIYVTPLPLAAGGLLQVGGYSDTGASERHLWANGGDSAPGTTVIDSYTLLAPIVFGGTASDVTIWLGNGYSGGGDSTWSGSVTLTGISSVSAVPEPSSWALMGLGAMGLVGWVGRSRRTAAV